MTDGKKWYGNVYVLLIVLISVLAIAVSSLLFLLIPQSSEIIRLMQWRMVTLRTFAVEADVKYQGTVARKDAQNVTRQMREDLSLHTQGFRDASDPASLRAEQAFTAVAGTEAPLTFAGKYVGLGDASFFNFKQLPERVGPLHFEEFRNRWLRVDFGDLFKDSDLALVGGDRPRLSDEDRGYLREQFRITPFLAVKDRLKNEPLGGVMTYHYQVEPVTLYFKDYFILAETKRLGRELTNKERAAADLFFSNVVPDPSGSELWIGTRDYYLHRMRLRFIYDNGAGRKGVLSINADFSRFNETAPSVTPTSGVSDITTVLQSLLPGLSGHLPMANKGPVRRGGPGEDGSGLPVDAVQPGDADNDEDGLPNSLEYFYGTDMNNKDTDGNGVSDNDEVNAGCNPVGVGRLFDFGITDVSGNCK